MTETKKRFIAGALCPECKAVDRVVMYRQGERNFRECVACGFKEEMHFETVSREPETRVSLSPEEKRAESRPVKILDPGSKPR